MGQPSVNLPPHILDDTIPEAGAFYIMDGGYLRLRSSLRIRSMPGVFCDSGKGKLSISPVVFSSDRRTDRSAMRLDNCAEWFLFVQRLSHKTPTYPLCGQGNRRTPGVFNQLFYIASDSHCTALYRCCWQVELFFKWIKQHLRIKVVLFLHGLSVPR